jgi:TolA-binding protein
MLQTYRVYLIFLLMMGGLQHVKAQGSLRNTGSLFQQGMRQYQLNRYVQARQFLSDYLLNNRQPEQAEEARYYIASSAYRAGDRDAKRLLEQFIAVNSSHRLAGRASFELGVIQFKAGKIEAAVALLQAGTPELLSKKEKLTRNFYLGYGYYQQKKNERAVSYLERVMEESDTVYRNDAAYYLGILAVQQQQFERAKKYFLVAEKAEKYEAVIAPYLCQIYYQQGKYEDLLAFANARPGRMASPAVKLLAGEAQFILGNFTPALQRYEEYTATNSPNRNLLYRMGYAAYAVEKNAKAEEWFQQVAGKQDTIGIYAAYYLGILYVKDNQLKFAANAFQDVLASDREIQPITSEATYQLGKVYLADSRFNEAIRAFNAYQQQQINADRTTEIQELLSEALLKTANYQQALVVLEKSGLPTSKLKNAYQKVSYLRGTELFNAGQYEPAIDRFKKSMQYGNDDTLPYRARYWLAEAQIAIDQPEQALSNYNQVLSGPYIEEKLKALYGKGYVYFNRKQYSDALNLFRKFTSDPEARQLNVYEDATLRLADCYYATKNYRQAVNIYNTVISRNSADADYAMYQKGVVLGLMDRRQEAIRVLTRCIEQFPESTYRNDAYFHRGQVEFEAGYNEAAIRYFTDFLEKFSSGRLPGFALIKRAQAHSNLNQNEKALTDYKALIDRYPKHEVANSALQGIQKASASLNRGTDMFEKYLAKYELANPDAENLAGLRYNAAKNLYFNQQYEQAIESFQQYQENHPQSPDAREADFYIAESFYQLNDSARALNYYREVYQSGETKRKNRVLQRLAELSERENLRNDAIRFYTQLAGEARNQREQNLAWNGLLTNYYERQDLDSAYLYARNLAASNVGSSEAGITGNLFRGRIAYERNNRTEAREAFAAVLEVTNAVQAAEAQFMLGKIKADAGKFEESNDLLFSMGNNFAQYDYWLGRAFLLIADNFLSLKENYQAKVTLQSVIDYSPNEEIVKQATEKIIAVEATLNKQEDTLRVPVEPGRVNEAPADTTTIKP